MIENMSLSERLNAWVVSNDGFDRDAKDLVREIVKRYDSPTPEMYAYVSTRAMEFDFKTQERLLEGICEIYNTSHAALDAMMREYSI